MQPTKTHFCHRLERGAADFIICMIVVLGSLAAVRPARAGGPRFVTGGGLWAQQGQPEGWSVSQLQYFTDSGDLAATVTHAQADAMVAAAAAVWNVPTSTLSLGQGGTLAEHVSSANTYFNGTSVVFPADVEVSNEGAVPVAVIYDRDGSVTDLLLGSGASLPVACRQNGVTESVDDLQMDGHIHHAMLILNGRCVGSAPEQMMQMQYQLTRAFGRILGLAWSQTNDNVFTAASTVTADQEAYWPVMHPLDVLCGTYTYQCMINPFTLRADDLSALATLYPVTAANQTSGKQISAAGAATVYGTVSFPTGQGMDWVNVTAHRQHAGVTETWELVSGITGYGYQQALQNPVTQVRAVNQGSYFAQQEGYYSIPVVPLDGASNVFFTSEPINPLYTGAYALGPYARPPATPSGSAQTATAWSELPGWFQGDMTAWDGASSCSPGNDGSEGSPAALDASGWQSGLLCGWGHSSWWGVTVRAGRTWALEVTATDETGAASTNKAQPVVGVWRATDPTGTLPTVASQAVPFNSMVYGMTQVRVGAMAVNTPLRILIGDQFGAGRPDFTYKARLLYADAVAPTSVGAGGGQITITGTGFRQGNVVTVNGVTATVQSWTSTQIVATAPARALAAAVVGRAVAVAVTDPTTGASTSMQSALTYTSAPNRLQQISAPAALVSGVMAPVPFAVRVLASDGVTALAGASVRFALSAGAAKLTACGAAVSCTATTDSTGTVQTSVIGGMAGTVTLTATETSGGATVQVSLADTDLTKAVAFLNQQPRYVAAGASGSWSVQLNATLGGVAASGVPVVWSVSPGLSLGAFDGVVGAGGVANVTVAAINLGVGSTNTLTGCVWDTVCATWTVYGVDPAQWQVSVASGAGQSVSEAAQLDATTVLVADVAGHAIEGAPVTVYQRVLAWEGACPADGRCAEAPVLTASQAVQTTDGNGQVTFTPAQVPGVPQTVEIAVAAGTQGFVTLTLVKTP